MKPRQMENRKMIEVNFKYWNVLEQDYVEAKVTGETQRIAIGNARKIVAQRGEGMDWSTLVIRDLSKIVIDTPENIEMDFQFYSDFHKEVYGFRPSHQQSYDFRAMSPEQRDITIEELRNV